MPFTFLRNSFYTENYTAQIPSYLARGAIVRAAGGALISAASRADYAAACVTALTQESHRNAVYELGGPPFTMDDVAEAVSRATGTRLEYRNVSPGELRDILIAAGMDADHASFVVRIEESIACTSAIRNLCTIQHGKDITNAARESAGNYEADDAPRRAAAGTATALGAAG